MDWKLIMMLVVFCSSLLNLLGGWFCSGHQPVKLMAYTLVYNKFQSSCSTSSKRYGLQHSIVAVKMWFNALATQWSTFFWVKKSSVCVRTAYSMLTEKNWHLDISWVHIMDVQKLHGARTPPGVRCPQTHLKFTFWP